VNRIGISNRGNALLPVPRDEAYDLTRAGGMADPRGIFKIKMLHQLGKVLGVLVDVVAFPGLARTSVASTIVGDDATPFLPQKQHFRVPSIGTQRPPVRERDHRPRSPVLVGDSGSIFRSKRVHFFLLHSV